MKRFESYDHLSAISGASFPFLSGVKRYPCNNGKTKVDPGAEISVGFIDVSGKLISNLRVFLLFIFEKSCGSQPASEPIAKRQIKIRIDM